VRTHPEHLVCLRQRLLLLLRTLLLATHIFCPAGAGELRPTHLATLLACVLFQ